MQSETKKSVSALSGEYTKAARSVTELTRKYNESVEKTGRTSKETKELKTQLAAAQAQLRATTAALKSANTGMDTFADSTQKASGESLTGAFTKANLLTGALVKLGTAAVSAAKNFIQTGINYNAQIEKYTTGLTNMLNSADAAQQTMEAIREDAARTPFNVDSLVSANQYLISAGENASYARKTILALGDAVAATGGGSDELNRMAQNLQQIANTGKATAVDIKQFAYAGINVYGILADYTGKSTEEVQNMTVSYDLLTKALQAASEEGGRYYNSMNTQSETLTGTLSTLQDNVTQLLGLLTEDLTDAFQSSVGDAIDWVQQLKDAFETGGAPAMLEAGGEIAENVVSGIAAKMPALEQQASACVEGFRDYLCAHMDTIVSVGGELLGNLALGIVNALPTLLSSAKEVKESFRQEIIRHLPEILEVGGQIIGALARGIIDYNVNVAKAAAKTAKTIVDTLLHTNWWQVGKSILDGIVAGFKGDAETAMSSGGFTLRIGAGRVKAETSNADPDPEPDGTSSGKQYKTRSATVETVIASVSRTVSAQSENTLGVVEKSIETLNEKIRDSSGNIKDRVTETVTETGKEMVNGVATTYKLVTTSVDGVVTKTTKSYEDLSKSLLGTLTTTEKKIVGGITTTTQTAVETYADGSQHIKATVTETGERIVDGVAQTYTKVITYVDGIEDNVTESVELIEKSIKASQKRIENYISEIENQASTGIIGLLKNGLNQITSGDFSGLSITFVKMLFGELSQDQREIITKWLADAMDIINEAYNGKGLAGALDILQKIFNGKEIKAEIDGVTTSLKGLADVLGGLAGSGKAGSVLAQAGTGIMQFGSKFVSVLGSVVGFVVDNPVVLAILAVAAGATAIGTALWKKYGSEGSGDTATQSRSTYKSPFAQTGVYDSLREFSTRAAMLTSYTTPTGFVANNYEYEQSTLLTQIRDLLDEHLPAIGTTPLVMDTGELVGVMTPRMAGNVDMQMGITVLRKERGV